MGWGAAGAVGCMGGGCSPIGPRGTGSRRVAKGTGTLTPAGSCPPARPPPAAPGTAQWAGCTATASARSNPAQLRHGRAVPTPSGVPPRHQHHPKTTVCDPIAGSPQPAMAGTPSKHPTAPKRVPQQECGVSGESSSAKNGDMGPPRRPWGPSQERLVRESPGPARRGQAGTGRSGCATPTTTPVPPRGLQGVGDGDPQAGWHPQGR